jgi:uncharacterized protein
MLSARYDPRDEDVRCNVIVCKESDPFMHFALIYDVVEGFSDKRMPHREPHLALVRAAHARGELVMAGALGDPPDGALLVFRGDSAEIAERFARADPYVVQGLATRWRVRAWNVVVGSESK